MKRILHRLPCDVERRRARLLCFTHAGGNTSEYRGWNDQLRPEIEQVLVQMPGRGCRYSEPCAEDVSSVVGEIVESLKMLDELPVAFFGHSMGCIIAYETTAAMIDCGMAPPSHLFFSGRKAAHLLLNRSPYYELEDEALIAEIKRLGCTGNELLDNEELVKLTLPVLRADFKLHDDYRFTPRKKLPVSMTVFGGTNDPSYELAELTRWGELTTREADVFVFRGGHFFVERHQAEITDIVNRRICRPNRVAGDCYSSGAELSLA